MKKIIVFFILCLPFHSYTGQSSEKDCFNFSRETISKRIKNGAIGAAAAAITSAALQSYAPLYFEKVNIGVIMPAFFCGYISPVTAGKTSFLPPLASGMGFGFLYSLPSHIGLAAAGTLIALGLASGRAKVTQEEKQSSNKKDE